MFPGRQLLYHRGLDDNGGTYITDYVYAAVCGALTLQLLIRIQKEKRIRYEKEDDHEVTSCRRFENWLPWNWPKRPLTAVTMTTYGIVLVGVANMMMALFGGLAHQYVQTVEADSNDPYNFRGWLILWRFAASFSALLSMALVMMTEQLIVQEKIFPIHPIIRRIYYVFFIVACVLFYLYNFLPVMTVVEDPFSIGKSFIVCFAVMLLYGVTTLALLCKYYCCCRRPTSDEESSLEYSPSHAVGNGSSGGLPCQQELYDCCKGVAGENADFASSRNLEMIFTAASPWLYVLAGVANHMLKDKCSDSDDAAAKLGCPLPNSFNHNALMHVIQIFALVGFFAAENISITRRRLLRVRMSESAMKRAGTSSTIYNDVTTSCTVVTDVNEKSPLKDTCLNNNHKPSRNRDDAVWELAAKEMEDTVNEIVSTSAEVHDGSSCLPKFPTSLEAVIERDSPDKRASVYDNMTHQNV